MVEVLPASLPQLVGYAASLLVLASFCFSNPVCLRICALMNRLFAALREQGVPGVHLGMATVNVRARGFYDRLGFEELPVPDPGPVTYLGMRL